MSSTASQCLASARELAKDAGIPLDATCLFLGVLLEGASPAFQHKYRDLNPSEVAAKIVNLYSPKTVRSHHVATKAVRDVAGSLHMLSPLDLLLAAIQAAPNIIAGIASYLGTCNDDVIASSRDLRYEAWKIAETASMEFNIDQNRCFKVVLYYPGRLMNVNAYSSIRSAGRIMRLIERLPDLGYSIDGEQDQDNNSLEMANDYVFFTLGSGPILTVAIVLPDGTCQVNL